MEKTAAYPTATLESVWAAFRESDRQRKEAEARFSHEMAASQQKFDRQMAERSAEFDRRSAEFDRRSTEFDKQSDKISTQIRELNETVTGMSKSDGLFAEEYFCNSFKQRKQTFFGETFDDIRKNLKGTESNDEYDIVLVNGKSVGIVEVKYRGRLYNISQITGKAQTFRLNFPKYKNHRIYLALASMIFHQRLEDECKNNGIAIVKQVGDTVVINDQHLKAY